MQKLYAQNRGDWTLALSGQEKALAQEGIYVSASLEETTGEAILKIVNRNPQKKRLEIKTEDRNGQNAVPERTVRIQELAGQPEDYNCIHEPGRVKVKERTQEFDGGIDLPAHSFLVARIRLF